jgi:hypothetical protein
MAKQLAVSAVLGMAAFVSAADPTKWNEDNVYASEQAKQLLRSAELKGNKKVTGEFHSHGYLHRHGKSEKAHYHDFSKIKEIIALEQRGAKYDNRSVLAGHTHEHTHKGFQGKHIHEGERREIVIFKSIEEKKKYVSEKKACKGVYTSKEGVELASTDNEVASFECLSSNAESNRINAITDVVCEGRKDRALGEDFEKPSTTAAYKYENKDKIMEERGCLSLFSRVYRGELTQFEYLWAQKMVKTARTE